MEILWGLVLFSNLTRPGLHDVMSRSEFLPGGDRIVSLTKQPRSRVCYRDDRPVTRLARKIGDGRPTNGTSSQDEKLAGSSPGRTTAVSDCGWEWRRMRDGWQPWPWTPVNVAPSVIASRASQLHPGVIALGLALFSIFALLACDSNPAGEAPGGIERRLEA